MLKSVSPHAKHCYERASSARQRASEVLDTKTRAEFLAAEAKWLKLAESYELSERLTRFLSRPTAVPEHPVCPACGMSMWLMEIQASLDERVFVYECKVCDTRRSVARPH